MVIMWGVALKKGLAAASVSIGITLTRTHARTNAPARPPARIHTNKHAHTLTRTHARTHSFTRHSRTHTHIHTRARTHARAHIQEHTRVHISTCEFSLSPLTSNRTKCSVKTTAFTVTTCQQQWIGWHARKKYAQCLLYNCVWEEGGAVTPLFHVLHVRPFRAQACEWKAGGPTDCLSQQAMQFNYWKRQETSFDWGAQLIVLQLSRQPEWNCDPLTCQNSRRFGNVGDRPTDSTGNLQR